MVLILDGNSEHGKSISRKIGLFEEKHIFVKISWSNQMPWTNQIIDSVSYMAAHFLVTL